MKFAKTLTVKEIAEYYNLEFIGNGNIKITGINEIHKVEKGDIAYVDNEKYYTSTINSAATVIIIDKKVEEVECKALLISKKPFEIYNDLIDRFMVKLEEPPVNNNCYISAEAIIGKGNKIYPGTYIANDVTIGKNCIIHPNVTIYNGVQIGNNVIIKANTIIGGDAFYYANFKKWHSCGRVIIKNDVNIGSGCTIDKGVSGDTIIGESTKIDNMVHIAHGVVVGKKCLLTAQVGIAGKSTIGDNVTILGDVGVVKDIRIGDGATILSSSLVTKDVPKGKTYFGNPARESKVVFKEIIASRMLPAWMKKVNDKLNI